MTSKHVKTCYLLTWPTSQTLTAPNAGEDVEQQELSYIASGLQNGTATLGENVTRVGG